MSKEEFLNFSINVHGPEITKWELDNTVLSKMFYAACKADGCDHDPKSWASGFVVAAGFFEDERITKHFFKRKENDKEDLKPKTYETFPFGDTPVKTMEIDGKLWLYGDDVCIAFMKEVSRLHSVGVKEGKWLAQQEAE